MISKYKKLVFLLAIVGALVSIPLSRVNAAATITVDSSADNTTAGDGFCTLREAITNANNDTDSTSGDCVAGSGTDSIEFDITSNEGVGPHSIQPTTNLPAITDAVTIDGTTEDGFVANNATAPAGLNGTMEIEVNGTNIGANDFGFNIYSSASGSVIRGLVINNWNYAVLLNDSDNCQIVGNYIGTNVAGDAAEANDFGVAMGDGDGAVSNTVGGSDPADRNLISGNTADAVSIGGISTSGNIVQGNIIGLNADGDAAIPNITSVYVVTYADNTQIGGDGVGEGNVMSGGGGLELGANASDILIQGNYIGLGSDGTTALGNNSNAIYLGNASNVTIGGNTAGARNIISDAYYSGIGIDLSDNVTIQGNYIGTDSSGTSDLGNGNSGISVSSSTGIQIGGDGVGEGNVISGNTNSGIYNESDGAIITGNYIGTAADGTTGLANDGNGISLSGANGNTIGGNTAVERNVISGNGNHGVLVSSTSANNIISGNYIGVGSDGSTELGNNYAGVFILSSAVDNLVGGSTTSEANEIAYNSGEGVLLTGSGTLDNAILGNKIHHNGSFKIDLNGDGSTANDVGDSDTGTNDLLNYPEWNTATENGGNTEATYTLDVPAGDYRVEFFSNNGRVYLDSQNITSTGSGSQDFSKTLTGDGYANMVMTATEIDAGNSSGFGPTSEYSDALSSGTSTITVNSTADDQDNDGECTLREAIVASNDNEDSGAADGECQAGAATDTIEFDLSGPSYTINPSSALPTITGGNLTINGYSQSGSVENSGDYSTCFEGTILVEIDGTGLGDNINGLRVSSDNVTIRGLAISNFTGANADGITIVSGSGSSVAGNIIGLDTEGLVDQGNADNGVEIGDSASNVTIGGSDVSDRNIISGNGGNGGISIYSDSGTNYIKGNCIGLDATGDAAVANDNDGINLYQSSSTNIIGGSTAGDKNVISGNTGLGVSLNESNVQTVAGNYIGTNADGTADLGNGSQGIHVGSNSTLTTIGGISSGARNVVSGNNNIGISTNSDGTGEISYIRGNYVGVGADGATDIGNSFDGLSIYGDDTIIGGTIAGAKNVISGNEGPGITIGGTATNTTIQGNYIGLSADGLTPIASGGTTSALISVNGDDNIIGGDSATERNYIAAGVSYGIQISGTSPFTPPDLTPHSGNVVQGNYIGTNIDGEIEAGFGNLMGVFLSFDAVDNVIGGTNSGEGNLIAGNDEGVVSLGINTAYDPNNSIIGNSIYENTGGPFLGGLITFDGIGIDNASVAGNFMSSSNAGTDLNDDNDVDVGSNDFLNFPVIHSITPSAGSFVANITLDTPEDAPNGYRIEFFANDDADPTHFGEGQYYLGYANVDGDVTNQDVNVTIDPGLITTGTYDITATTTERDNSTDGFGATSEFSFWEANQSIIQPLDNDGDGVNDAIEDGGPNGGDGNGDGTPDSEQTNVATILDANNENYLTLELDSDGTCTQIDDFRSVLESDLADQDPDYIYPLTLTEFVIPCADSVDGTIFWHGEEQFADQVYRKYGPTTPGDSGTTSWYNSDFTLGATTVGGESVATASFNLTDGALGDDTGDDDSIVDANGPGLPVSDSVADSVSNLLADTGFNIYLILLTATTLMFGSAMVLKRKHGNS